MSTDGQIKRATQHREGRLFQDAQGMNNEETSKLALFEGREIRKSFQNGEWWFSIIDVVEALVGGDRPRKYWSDLKKKLIAEGYFEVSEKIGQLKMVAPDGNLIKHFLGGRLPLGALGNTTFYERSTNVVRLLGILVLIYEP